jgi:hypothetical protein
VENLKELEIDLKDAIIKTQEAKNLLYNGKVIQSDRKLQGVLVKLNTMLNYILSCEIGESDVANKVSSEH